MAIDTRNKRASALVLIKPWMIVPPYGDGTIDAADRSHLAFLYAGIVLEEPAVVVVPCSWMFVPTWKFIPDHSWKSGVPKWASFEALANKDSSNEGDHIATDNNPVWTERTGHVPVTTSHKPCGYWWKK